MAPDLPPDDPSTGTASRQAHPGAARAVARFLERHGLSAVDARRAAATLFSLTPSALQRVNEDAAALSDPARLRDLQLANEIARLLVSHGTDPDAARAAVATLFNLPVGQIGASHDGRARS